MNNCDQILKVISELGRVQNINYSVYYLCVCCLLFFKKSGIRLWHV